jgi:hypothetical protein
MPNYKAPDNSLHFLDDASLEHILPSGCVQITEEEAEALRPTPVTPSIVVSPRQIRQALTAAGLRTQVESAISSGNQDMKDWWEFATQFEEDHSLVVAMAKSLNVSKVDLHDLFLLASTL